MSLVSIIMPCYNSESTILNAVRSVLEQTYSSWELLIVDDCSTDKTLEVLDTIKDNRVKIITLKKNSGSPAAPRNKGLDLARGDYIAFLDSDDVWSKDKLKIQIEFMKSNELKFTCTAYSIDDASSNLNYYPPKYVTYHDLLYNNTIGCLTAVVTRDLVGNERFPSTGHEDFAFWLQLLKKTDGVYSIGELLATYNKTEGSVSSDKLKLIGFFWNIYRKVEGFGYFKSLYCCFRYFLNVSFFKYR